ncbi:MAB_1171c family putative transporter [Gordonia sp. CPCC 205333]|uniref:MAB_1171c family putative transporter n=1 Tax=Gordonia sp. CPCC 205333 TaxID=3140790 RepID=UPI003AF407C1
MVAGIINVIAFAVFACAMCWRLDQIRRQGGGVQAVAMTTAIGSLTLAFVVSNKDVTAFLNDELFTGASRVLLYGLLALGVASLIVVFFFSSTETVRQRRAGVESIPLVVAVLGLQITMLLIPLDLRTQGLSASTTRNAGFALFFLIASGYLAYGLLQCVRSIRRFLAMAGGYLKVSLLILMTGLILLAAGSMAQIVYVLGSLVFGVSLLKLVQVATIFSVIGLVAFLIGICYPMAYAKTRAVLAGLRRRRRYRELEPLWTLITWAIPSVVLPGHGGTVLKSTPTVLFERRIVEIRDGLTQLSPLLSEDFDDGSDADRAELLRAAVDEYREAGTSKGAVRDVLPPDGTSLDDDAEPLLRLARVL